MKTLSEKQRRKIAKKLIRKKHPNIGENKLHKLSKIALKQLDEYERRQKQMELHRLGLRS